MRVSENRFGYTLSYRIEDRCCHRMVELDSHGRYALVGVPKVCPCLLWSRPGLNNMISGKHHLTC